ncbi:hypothetical protein FE257_008199 [Aspergillus nanangensis]|uniref:Amidase domain-containing protein n=1 Tax=Aspergillus nanangensis TaxID=2582783 RepID=A0AAD4CLP6_ASPNN|nr:hypothetical protein FE257_008199 [Aspergillus nanangensis]
MGRLKLIPWLHQPITHCISLKGQIVGLDSVNYYIPPNSIASVLVSQDKIAQDRLTEPLYPVTIIDFKKTDQPIEDIVEIFQSSDDVFNVWFLEVIISKGCSKPMAYILDSVKLKYGTKSVITSCKNGGHQDLPPGPYFWSPGSGTLYPAYRLYSDVQGAFTQGLIPTEHGTYTGLPAAVPGAASITVGVPSRLYTSKDSSKPLAGVRIGVKDIFDVAGVKTSSGSRAYYDMYPPANSTAPAIQRLLDAGAVLVGKMKTSQFANGEWATADWVDYHAPFNPRGDGYQDPGSSSSGPAAGVASYDWLDLTIGADTGGSIRGPAASNGVYGNRPSHGLTSLEGIMPLSPRMDTVGILTRETTLWRKAASVLYGDAEGNSSLPKRLYTVDFPVKASSPADGLLISFANSLAKALDAIAEPFDIDQRWSSSESTSLQDLVGNVFSVLTTKQQFQMVGAGLYKKYGAENDKRRPFVDPSPLTRWNWGIQQPASAISEAIHNLTTFTNWWHIHGQSHDVRSCSNSIIIYPGSKGETSYRNGPYPIEAPGVPSGFGIDRVPSFAGSPDFAVPSEFPYSLPKVFH